MRFTCTVLKYLTESDSRTPAILCCRLLPRCCFVFVKRRISIHYACQSKCFMSIFNCSVVFDGMPQWVQRGAVSRFQSRANTALARQPAQTRILAAHLSETVGVRATKVTQKSTVPDLLMCHVNSTGSFGRTPATLSTSCSAKLSVKVFA